MQLASERFQTSTAPSDVLLAQELINTRPPDGTGLADLLATTDSAQDWLDAVIAARTDGTQEALALRVRNRDLIELRELRTVVESSVARDGTQQRALRGGLQLSAHEGGGVGVGVPTATPAAWYEAMLLEDSLRAELLGGWPRLKLCANPACRVAFYDRSRNRAGVWHNVERCGNKINLRNHRARRAAEV